MSAPGTAAAQHSPLRNPYTVLVLTLGLHALLGVSAALQLHWSPFGDTPVLDELGYVQWARGIVSGDVLGADPFSQDPLFPYFLALLFKLFGGSLLAARLFQVGLGLGTTALLFATGRRLFSPWAGAVAALVFSFHGVIYLYEAELIKATLGLFSVALFFYALARATADARLRWWAAVGATFALLMLYRGNFVPLLPFLAGWAGFHASREWRRRLVVGAVVLGSTLLVLSPVTIRNYVVSGDFILTRSHGGSNFYIGNNPAASGSYVRLPFVRSSPEYEAIDLQAEAERRTGHKMLPTEVSRFWFQEGFNYLRANPEAWARLWWAKVLLALNAYEVPDNYSFECMRSEFMPALYLGVVDFGVLLALAALGAVLAMRERRLRVLVIGSLLYAGTLVFFYVFSRYRVPLVIPLVLLAGHGVASFGVFRRDARHLALAAGLVVFMLGVSHVTLKQTESREHLMAQCYSLLGATQTQRGEHESAVEYLRRSAALDGSLPESWYNLGVAQHTANHKADAEQAYERAISLNPRHGQAMFNLSLLHAERGDTGGARALLERAIAAGFDNAKSRAALEALR